MATISSTRAALRPLSLRSAWRLLIQACGVLLAWERRLRDRDHLASLDDRTLADLGISRDAVRREYDKSFWRE